VSALAEPVVVDAAVYQAITSELQSHRVRANVQPVDISHAADLWLGELRRQAKSERTLSRYRRLLDKLADAYPGSDIDEVTASMCRRFLDSQQVRRRRLSADEPQHLSKATVTTLSFSSGGSSRGRTIAGDVSILAGFFKWLYREQLVKRNPAERIMLTTDDVVRLLAEADKFGWPHRLAVNTLVYLGPRRRAAAPVACRRLRPGRTDIAVPREGGPCHP
jgi:hypothetical protein